MRFILFCNGRIVYEGPDKRACVPGISPGELCSVQLFVIEERISYVPLYGPRKHIQGFKRSKVELAPRMLSSVELRIPAD